MIHDHLCPTKHDSSEECQCELIENVRADWTEEIGKRINLFLSSI
jgi:hypothetical protein